MNSQKVKLWILSFLVMAVVLVSLPNIPKTINVVGSCILNCLALTSCGFIFLYYHSLPALKKTILVLLMQLLIITHMFILIQGMLMKLIADVIPSVLETGLKTAPNLACSIAVKQPFLVLIYYWLFAIISFKAMATGMSAKFLALNHYRVCKLTLVAICVAWILEYIIIFYLYGTVCSKPYIYYLKTFLGLNFEVDNMKNKPPTSIIHMTMLILLKPILMIGKYLRKKLIQNKKVEHLEMSTLTSVERLVKAKYQINQSVPFNQNAESPFEEQVEDMHIIDIEEGTGEFSSRIFSDEIENQEEVEETENVYEDIVQHCSLDIEDLDSLIDATHVSANQYNNQILLPRRNSEIEIWTLFKENDLIGQTEPKNEPITSNIPKLLKIDIAIWLIMIVLILVVFHSFDDKNKNDNVLWVIIMIGDIIFLVLPHYWILRSEEKIAFIKRRLDRWMKQF